MDKHIVPHLKTTLTGSLLEIERHLLDGRAVIESWFRSQWRKTPAPFYASVDLRNAGFKLAPVDTNLFPAGFNNLAPELAPLCVQAIQSSIERLCPDSVNILLIPENHTRNTYYLESLDTLCNLFSKAGFNIRIGSLLPDMKTPLITDLPSGGQLCIEPLIREDNVIKLADFTPCLIILNNDLSGGKPDILKNITQPIIPPLDIGWSNRFKSQHFSHYNQVAKEFSEQINIDPWLINPLFLHCGEINFKTRAGEECLAEMTAKLLQEIRKKYDQYNIDQKPFVVIKADTGTYGMAVMTISDPSEVLDLNRKKRNKMSFTKGGQAVANVMIQEGVHTFETVENSFAEPVVYMIDRYVVGGFYRVHTQRGPNENLNAPGMHFEPLAFAESCNLPDQKQSPNAHPNRFYAYGVIARLALLASAREIFEIKS